MHRLDGVGGAVVSWTDSRLSTNNTDIYAQRVNAEGVLKWEAEGRAVCTAASVQNFHTLAPGPLGSAILAWSDFRTGAYDVYAGSPDSTSVSVVSVGWERPVTGRIGHLRPNPTRAGAALDFELTTSQRVSIEVLDVNGRRAPHRQGAGVCGRFPDRVLGRDQRSRGPGFRRRLQHSRERFRLCRHAPGRRRPLKRGPLGG